MSFAATGLHCIAAGTGSQPSLWIYTSVDAHGSVEATDYFAAMRSYGMKTGDVVIVVDSDTGGGNTTIHSVVMDSDGNGTINAALLA